MMNFFPAAWYTPTPIILVGIDMHTLTCTPLKLEFCFVFLNCY